MTDLKTKPCGCGAVKEQIIGFHPSGVPDSDLVPVRKGWYCFSCKAWEDAILRERTVERGDL